MKQYKKIITLVTLLMSVYGFSQENIFLSRDYWSTNPSIKDIDSKIKEGHNIAQANSNNFDAVVYAILQNAPNKTIECIQSKKGNDVNKLTHDGRTYIFWAAYKGNVEFMDYLLKKGAKTDLTDDKGNTILNFAASSGQQNTKVYDLCIANGADLKIDLNPNGANALLLAAPSDEDFKLINYFQSKGLDIKSVDSKGNGVFNYVAKTGNIKLMNALLDKGVKGNDQAFLFAAYGTRGTTNGVEVYKYLESQGLNPNTFNEEDVSPLHIVASRSKDIELIYYLLEKGLDVNTKDAKGNNAVMNAASRNTLEVVKIFIENLKTINDTNKKGQSALSLAVQGNTPDVVEFLIKKGYDTTIIDAKGNNLAYYLANSYSIKNVLVFNEKMELFKRNKLDLAAVQKNGNTWFHFAVKKNSITLLKLALEMDQDINVKNNEGNTALLLAAMTAENTEVLKFLMDQGADKTITTDFEETAYDLAKENELLKKNKVSIEFLK
ncbi:ankyrin repeat domain-containing protein [Psychroserpens ponticola]|uniref:Ankyrin repeat domain-containing protein n=1 Tax=Psychroserpens ponticola TaxID=2932268 RepID=A0ABY7S015_9FLAO|nr:ankyrin repeat domain-containing protein [Psychroserpens ponticola]WCO02667.1 ankyrin repeat domain-containing protein [Psychroserpens ponticola]